MLRGVLSPRVMTPHLNNKIHREICANSSSKKLLFYVQIAAVKNFCFINKRILWGVVDCVLFVGRNVGGAFCHRVSGGA